MALALDRDAEATLRRGLRERFDQRTITLHASGRDALRVAFASVAASTGRSEIAVPAYSCYSIPAAAVAAGLRVRLVDVGDRGQLDQAALSRLPLERTASVVIANLFGVPEAFDTVDKIAQHVGASVIDDAAQTFGGSCAEGNVGARADIGILSFGRGKPLSALGGGALVWRQAPDEDFIAEATQPPKRWAALLRAAVYDAARNPVILRVLSAIPALGIGTTLYDPDFPQGPMPGAAVALAAALLPDFEARNRSRALRTQTLACRLSADTDFVSLLAAPGDTGVYPRLGVLAPTSAKRDHALAALRWLGATRMYPEPLDQIPALRRHLVGETECPGAHDFSSRLLTLPTHQGLHESHIDEIVRILRQL